MLVRVLEAVFSNGKSYEIAPLSGAQSQSKPHGRQDYCLGTNEAYLCIKLLRQME